MIANALPCKFYIENIITDFEIHYIGEALEGQILRASGFMPFVSKTIIKNSGWRIADSIPIDKIMSIGYDKDIIQDLKVIGGCNGNLTCPDQISKALVNYKNKI